VHWAVAAHFKPPRRLVHRTRSSQRSGLSELGAVPGISIKRVSWHHRRRARAGRRRWPRFDGLASFGGGAHGLSPGGRSVSVGWCGRAEVPSEKRSSSCRYAACRCGSPITYTLERRDWAKWVARFPKTSGSPHVQTHRILLLRRPLSRSDRGCRIGGCAGDVDKARPVASSTACQSGTAEVAQFHRCARFGAGAHGL
jgi:hypothetical protein